MLTSTLRRAAVLVAVGAATLMGPAAAFGAHDIYVYKLDKQVLVNQDEMSASLTCKRTVGGTDYYDYAVDGMWRIDHADQDDPPQTDADLASTEVTQAELNGDGSTYDFNFIKNANGDVQLKVFVTCLRMDTDTAYGHSHPLELDGGIQTAAISGVTGPSSASGSCPDDEVLISPGFRYTPGTLGDPTGRELASYPLDPMTKAARYERTWTFDMQAAGDTAYLSYRCLKIKVGAATAGNSKHKLGVRFWGTHWQPGAPPNTNGVSVFTTTLTPDPLTRPGGEGRYDEVQSICGDHSKGLVSAWWQGDGGGFPSDAGDNKDEVTYLGQDPRLKSRSFRFLTEVSGHQVTTGLLCFNNRTT